jgi:hypothetical protein
MKINNPQNKQIESIVEEIISKYGRDIALKVANKIKQESIVVGTDPVEGIFTIEQLKQMLNF